ncbi:MAG: hypothetical protein OEN55_11250 [Alphaproteobacteria bacterium]|nr:hypothetical protein [Alphaproteobacteria bacterium]
MGNRPARPTVTPEQAVVTLHGASREIYGFTPFPLDAPPPLAGIYAFAAPAGAEAGNTLYWRLLFVGETGNIGARAGASHEWLAAAKKQGATRILVHICSRDEDFRRFIEDDLVAAFDPPLNALQRRAAAA